MKLAIIADDFTGSNDTGGQFAKKGLHTVVTTVIDKLQPDLMSAEVLVCDTESRFDLAETAYEKNHNIARQLRDAGTALLYKKIDSTFRGNIGAELAGAMDGFGINVMFLIPALPSNGRITRDGNVIVNGTYLHETEVAKDPRTPVTKSYIPDIIKEQSNKKVLALTEKDIPADSGEFHRFIRAKRAEGTEIFVFDATDNEQLKNLSNLVSSYPEECILAGTAGLAEFVPDSFNLRTELPVLAIVGSVSEVSRGQIDFALNQGSIEIVPFNKEGISDPSILKETADLVCKKLSEGINVALCTAYDSWDIAREKKIAEQMNITLEELSDRIARALGTCTAAVLDKSGRDISGLFITGGDTLIKVADYLGALGMTISEEVLPAIPSGYLIHEKYNRIKVVTKAGSFGSEDALQKIIKYIRNT